jgi:NitT/TauT family transport system substrate-binding protein
MMKTNRRTLLKSIAATGALLAFPAIAKSPAAIRITLPSPGSAGSAWQPLVEKLGLAREYDLDLNWVTANPGQMQIQLATGSLDIGVFGAVGLGALVNRGSDITLFGPALNNHGRWIVHGDSPYRTPKDLIGKTLATTSESSETYQQARITASLIGIDLKSDLRVVHGSPTANLAIFERRDVDGLITLEPTATRLVGRGAREIARVADLWKQATGAKTDPVLLGLAASNQWLNRNRDTASRVARLFTRLGQEIQNKPALLQEVAEDMGLRAEESHARSLFPERVASAYSVSWDESVFQVIDRQIQVAVKLGILDKLPNRPLYTRL